MRVRLLYFSRGQPRGVDAECTNISTEGLYVKTHRRGAAIGTAVSIILKLDPEQDEEELMVEGIVRWHGGTRDEGDDHQGAGMGVEFLRMEPPVRERLDALLAELRSEDGGED